MKRIIVVVRCSMATCHPSWRLVLATSWLLVVIAAALLGCRGTPNASGVEVHATPAPCPPSIPTAGIPCPAPDPYVHFCEYGGDSHTDCTTLVDCAAEQLNAPLHWIHYPPAATCGQNAQLGCPATSSGVQEGAPCTPVVALPGTYGRTDCLYADAVCGCLPSCWEKRSGVLRGTMHCRLRTDVPAGCPTPRPRLGDACAADGLWCDYSGGSYGLALGPAMQCLSGYWRLYASGAGTRPPLPPCP